MRTDTLTRFFLLPELELVRSFAIGKKGGIGLEVRHTCEFAVCPFCAKQVFSVHDKRVSKVRDEPVRGKSVFLFVEKRRFRCRPCGKVFTEHIPGIGKGKRTTERLRRAICWAAENFSSMVQVQKAYRCSAKTVYTATYEQLELRQRSRTYPLPAVIGIDEHSIKKPRFQSTIYSTIVIDHKNTRVFDLFEGRSVEELSAGFSGIKGEENVKFVTMDLSPTYRSFTKQRFSKATIVADRFHVQRLFTKMVNRFRKRATGDKRKNPIRKLLLRNNSDLEPFERSAVKQWLLVNPDVNEVYQYKEAVRRFYRAKGVHNATIVFRNLLNRMAKSKHEQIRQLRKTIFNWRHEIMAYHVTKLSNGRTEGFNRKAKLCQRAAYGYRNFSNYRLKLLNLCR